MSWSRINKLAACLREKRKSLGQSRVLHYLRSEIETFMAYSTRIVFIVEFEQGGNAKAKYGDKLLINLSKDLTRLKGKGFSRSNLTYMRKLYLVFPKCETLSHQLTWSHYFELLKCEDKLEMQL